jgi:hypothetical protein
VSWNPLLEPAYPDAVSLDAIETLIVACAVDLGGFEVRRALPAEQRQMVGRSSSLTILGRWTCHPGREPTCVPAAQA